MAKPNPNPKQKQKQPIRKNAADNIYSSRQRIWPPLANLCNPMYLVRTGWRFFLNWVFSRPYAKLLFGIPSLAVAVFAIYVGLSLAFQPPDRNLTVYKRAVAKASENEDTAEWETALNTLIQLDPDDPLIRLNLAMYRAKEENYVKALSMMRTLAKEKYEPARLWLAQRLINAANPKLRMEAIQHLQDVISDNPRHVGANATLGQIYLMQRRFNQAERCLRRAAQAEPQVRLQLAKALRALQRPEDAELEIQRAKSDLEEAVKKNPKNIPATILLAESSKDLGNLLGAQETITTALKENPENEQLRSAFGKLVALSAGVERIRGAASAARFRKLLLTALEYAPGLLAAVDQLDMLGVQPEAARPEVISAIRKRLEGLPEKMLETPPLLVRMAFVHRMQSDNEKAADCLTRAVEKAPNLGLRCATIFRLMNQPDQAKQVAGDYLKRKQAEFDKDPEQVRTRIEVASALLFLKRSDEARELLKGANPEDRNIRAASLQLLLQQHNLATSADERFSLLQAMHEIAPQNTVSITGLRLLAQEQNEIGEKAIAFLTEQLASEDRHPAYKGVINATLGAVYTQRRSYKKALPYFRRAHELDVKNPVYMNNLAHVLANVEPPNLNRGMELIDEALSKFPYHAEVLETRGEILIKLRKPNEALLSLEKALSQSAADNKRQVHLLMAEAYALLGDKNMADEHRRKADQSES